MTRSAHPPHVQALIDALELTPHPEGGFFRETWRASLTLPPEALPPGYDGARSAGTSILFLLPAGARSRAHRVRSDELWIHQQGDPVQLTIGALPGGADAVVTLGRAPEHTPQALVAGGQWQEALALDGDAGYALVACVVVPGFDFADFEMAED